MYFYYYQTFYVDLYSCQTSWKLFIIGAIFSILASFNFTYIIYGLFQDLYKHPDQSDQIEMYLY